MTVQLPLFGTSVAAAPAPPAPKVAWAKAEDGVLYQHTVGSDGITRWAVLSRDKTFRYELGRRWGGGPLDLWVMLNPSLADGIVDDPTLRRIIGFSQRWGSGGLIVVNLFALRSSKPAALTSGVVFGPPGGLFDPVGPLNDVAVRENVRAVAESGGRAIAAWGSSISFNGPDSELTAHRDRYVLNEIRKHKPVWCLAQTMSGAPTHPLARGKHRVPDNASLSLYMETL